MSVLSIARAFTSLTLLAAAVTLAACGDAPPADLPGSRADDQALANGIVLPPPGSIGTGPITVATYPLSLSGFAIWDRATSALMTATPMNGALRWPSPYALETPHVHFAWATDGTLSATDMANIATGTGWAVQMFLDGQQLGPAVEGQGYGTFYTTVATPSLGAEFGCPQGQTCLLTSVDGAILHDHPAPWHLELVYWRTIVRLGGTISKQTVYGYVQPNANPRNYFQDEIAPIFQSGACSKCHSLGSPEVLATQHRGLLDVSQIGETVTDHGTQLRCGGGCHTDIAQSVPGTTFTVTEWMVPAFDMGIDWTGKTPSQICNTVKSHLPTAAEMDAHFFQDARIGWAVNSGVLPLGAGSIPKAPPGNFTDFVSRVSAWIDGEGACP
ncbi:MAG TPA: hypothetical protein VGI39_04095 [Polyangiaceae bacterium]